MSPEAEKDLKTILKKIHFTDDAQVMKQLVDQSLQVKIRMGQIRRKIVIMSGKGGVGKSMTTANISLAFARQGTEWTLLAPLLFPPILLTVNIPQSVILQRNDVFWILTVVMICSAALHAPSTAPIARPVEPVDAHLPVSVRP